MKKIIVLIIVLVVAGVVWWLGSPLFLDTTVNEEFPTLEEVENMSDSEKAEIQKRMMEQAAAMPPVVMEEEMPEEQPKLLVQGIFHGADGAHQGSGIAGIYTLADASTILRFEDFLVTNGPDLRVLLATGENPTDSDSLGEYIELGKLKGNQGNQNYEIPEGTDLSQYNSIVIYCRPFHVVFAVAPL